MAAKFKGRAKNYVCRFAIIKDTGVSGDEPVLELCEWADAHVIDSVGFR